MPFGDHVKNGTGSVVESAIRSYGDKKLRNDQAAYAMAKDAEDRRRTSEMISLYTNGMASRITTQPRGERSVDTGFGFQGMQSTPETTTTTYPSGPEEQALFGQAALGLSQIDSPRATRALDVLGRTRQKPDNYTLGPNQRRFSGSTMMGEGPIVAKPGAKAAQPRVLDRFTGSDGKRYIKLQGADGKTYYDPPLGDKITVRQSAGSGTGAGHADRAANIKRLQQLKADSMKLGSWLSAFDANNKQPGPKGETAAYPNGTIPEHLQEVRKSTIGRLAANEEETNRLNKLVGGTFHSTKYQELFKSMGGEISPEEPQDAADQQPEGDEVDAGADEPAIGTNDSYTIDEIRSALPDMADRSDKDIVDYFAAQGVTVTGADESASPVEEPGALPPVLPGESKEAYIQRLKSRGYIIE